MNLKRFFLALSLLFVLPMSLQASHDENHMRSVIAVNDLTVEVQMAKPLTEDELSAARFDEPGHVSEFLFSDGVEAVGAPIPQRYDGFHDNVYQIPVNGLEVGPIYKISYKGQKALTFKAYRDKEMKDRYADRWGDYF